MPTVKQPLGVCTYCGTTHPSDDLESCREALRRQLEALRELEGPAIEELWRVLRETEELKLAFDDLTLSCARR